MDTKFIRTSALWHRGCGLSRTKVIFTDETNRDNQIAYWMDRDVYDAIPLGTKATPDDYRKHGQLDQADNLKIHSNE